MSIQGLDWQVVQYPFAAGLDTKTQSHAVDPSSLTACLNGEFDEVGAIRTRKPYSTTGLGASIYPSGTLSNVRKLATVDDELLCFTSTALYSWSATLSKWLSRGTHLAVKVEEATRFGNTYDQVFADRAQLSGVVVMCWTEVIGASVLSYVAAYDDTTDVTLIAPTSLGAGETRPRVLALSTKILVTWIASGAGIVGKVIDPAAPAFTASSPTTLTASVITRYDIVKDPAADQAVWAGIISGGTDYGVGKVTAGLAVSSATKTQTCDGTICLSVAPAAANRITVVRVDGGDIKGDLINLASLADVTMDTTVGTIDTATTGCTNMTCAHRSTTDGGFYRCYAFWTNLVASGSTSYGKDVKYNYIDTNAAVGTEASFIRQQDLASRAFDYGGSIYVWTAFGATSGVSGSVTVTSVGLPSRLQNTYFLHRDDVHLVSKATWRRGGGAPYYTNHLPGVALISGSTVFAWAGVERQIITTGGEERTAYSARAPRDIAFTFDSDDARRTVQLGRTLYIAGGLLLQYDGEALTEVGFCQFPWGMSFSVTGAGSSIAAGQYGYIAGLRWDNARGEFERSTTGIGALVTVGANDQVDISVTVTNVTHKTGSIREPALEIWRTVIAPPPNAPLYLVTSRDPAATGDNGHVLNDVGQGAMSLQGDVFVDATLTTKEQHPENSSVLPRVGPPGATIICASDTRLFLAGIPGEPNRVWYSLLRNDGEICGFNDALSFSLPAATGAITALARMNDMLVVFTASAVYAVPGDGFDNTGGGVNYGPPQIVSSDVGALSHDTVALTPLGLVFFARKGWYRLRGLEIEYIGAPVEDYNSDTWVAAQVVESQHQLRVLSSSRMLVYDYLVGQWAEWSQASGCDLAIWQATPVLLDTTVKKEQSVFTDASYDLDIELAPFKPAGLQGFARCRRVMILGRFRADHTQRVRIAYDYGAFVDDASMAFSGLVADRPTQLRQGPSRQRFEAMKVRITVAASGADTVVLTGIAFEVGLRKGLYPRLPAAQKQ